jgi:hypothetical protein
LSWELVRRATAAVAVPRVAAAMSYRSARRLPRAFSDACLAATSSSDEAGSTAS